MALKIERGLFSNDFTDHHAVLGVAVDASPKDIRKRYLKIARRLHPDSSAIKTEAERQLANELLSKLVNPAYEKLTQEKDQAEYALLLKLKGKQACQQQETISLTTDGARQLAGTNNFASSYNSSLTTLSGKQYDSLAETIDIIGEISELNLVYLMKQAQDGGPAPRPTPSPPSQPNEEPESTATSTTSATAKKTPPIRTPGRKPTRQEILDRYLERARSHESLGKFPEAIREMREALKFEPKSSECHSRLGAIYLRNKQPTMAKVHFNQALKLNPRDEIAQAGLRRLGSNTVINAQGKKGSAKRSDKASSGKKAVKAKGKDKSGGGLFGLFGGKKK
ncbi:MAG: tetratricopeptide repeat protein [Cyanobacteria bacterium P01_F01_bin.150]